MIDFEAATKELADWLTEQEGITDIAEAARLVVVAALGDEALYQKRPCDGDHFIPEGTKCLELTWVQVFPTGRGDD